MKRFVEGQSQLTEDLEIDGASVGPVSQHLAAQIRGHRRISVPRHLSVVSNDISRYDKCVHHMVVGHPLRSASAGSLEPLENSRVSLRIANQLTTDQINLALLGTGPERD